MVIGVDGRKQGEMPIRCDYLYFVASYYSLVNHNCSGKWPLLVDGLEMQSQLRRIGCQ